jgi:hypothetical protein
VTDGVEPASSDAYKLVPPSTLVVERRLGVPKVRQCVRISHTSPNIQIAPFNENLETLRRAVAERVFLVKEDGAFRSPPKPSPGHFADQLAGVRDLLKPFLPSTAPMDLRATVDTFKGCKRKRYMEAYNNILFKRSTLSKDAAVSVFVKYEKTDRTTKKDPVPRVISPRSPEFNLRVARYLRKIEDKVFDALGDLFGHKTVMKGVTMDQTARLVSEKWNMFRRPVAVGLDASRFDQHVSREALEFEHTIYKECFRLKKDKVKLGKLLKYQLKNHCTGYTEDGKVSYTTDGTRMSGDMNTSLGNCVLMCMMIKGYAMSTGIDLQLANNGDDCVVFLEQSDLPKFRKNLNVWFRKMGFNMVVEDPSYCLEDVEFCQTRPVFDGSRWVMCRNPWTAIAKDSVLLKHPKSVSSGYFKQWCDAVGTGGIALAGGMPVFQSFYQLMKRSGQVVRKNSRGIKKFIPKEHLPYYMQEGQRGNRRVSPITDEARASFYFAFDITPDEQIELENYYDLMVIQPQFGDWHPRAVFTSRV